MNVIENNKHRIENDKDTLSNLMRKVKGEYDRSRDFLAPTHDLQKGTTDDGLPYVVMEASKGVPTQLFDINEVAFSQISSNAGIDVRTARRLQEQVPTEFDSVVNALWRKTQMFECLERMTMSAGHPLKPWPERKAINTLHMVL